MVLVYDGDGDDGDGVHGACILSQVLSSTPHTFCILRITVPRNLLVTNSITVPRNHHRLPTLNFVPPVPRSSGVAGAW